MADSIFLEVTIKSVHAPGPLFAVVPPGDQAVLTASLIGKSSSTQPLVLSRGSSSLIWRGGNVLQWQFSAREWARIRNTAPTLKLSLVVERLGAAGAKSAASGQQLRFPAGFALVDLRGTDFTTPHMSSAFERALPLHPATSTGGTIAASLAGGATLNADFLLYSGRALQARNLLSGADGGAARGGAGRRLQTNGDEEEGQDEEEESPASLDDLPDPRGRDPYSSSSSSSSMSALQRGLDGTGRIFPPPSSSSSSSSSSATGREQQQQQRLQEQEEEFERQGEAFESSEDALPIGPQGSQTQKWSLEITLKGVKLQNANNNGSTGSFSTYGSSGIGAAGEGSNNNTTVPLWLSYKLFGVLAQSDVFSSASSSASSSSTSLLSLSASSPGGVGVSSSSLLLPVGGFESVTDAFALASSPYHLLQALQEQQQQQQSGGVFAASIPSNLPVLLCAEGQALAAAQIPLSALSLALHDAITIASSSRAESAMSFLRANRGGELAFEVEAPLAALSSSSNGESARSLGGSSLSTSTSSSSSGGGSTTTTTTVSASPVFAVPMLNQNGSSSVAFAPCTGAVLAKVELKPLGRLLAPPAMLAAPHPHTASANANSGNSPAQQQQRQAQLASPQHHQAEEQEQPPQEAIASEGASSGGGVGGAALVLSPLTVQLQSLSTSLRLASDTEQEQQQEEQEGEGHPAVKALKAVASVLRKATTTTSSAGSTSEQETQQQAEIARRLAALKDLLFRVSLRIRYEGRVPAKRIARALGIEAQQEQEDEGDNSHDDDDENSGSSQWEGQLRHSDEDSSFNSELTSSTSASSSLNTSSTNNKQTVLQSFDVSPSMLATTATTTTASGTARVIGLTCRARQATWGVDDGDEAGNDDDGSSGGGGGGGGELTLHVPTGCRLVGGAGEGSSPSSLPCPLEPFGRVSVSASLTLQVPSLVWALLGDGNGGEQEKMKVEVVEPVSVPLGGVSIPASDAYTLSLNGGGVLRLPLALPRSSVSSALLEMLGGSGSSSSSTTLSLRVLPHSKLEENKAKAAAAAAAASKRAPSSHPVESSADAASSPATAPAAGPSSQSRQQQRSLQHAAAAAAAREAEAQGEDDADVEAVLAASFRPRRQQDGDGEVFTSSNLAAAEENSDPDVVHSWRLSVDVRAIKHLRIPTATTSSSSSSSSSSSFTPIRVRFGLPALGPAVALEKVASSSDEHGSASSSPSKAVLQPSFPHVPPVLSGPPVAVNPTSERVVPRGCTAVAFRLSPHNLAAALSSAPLVIDLLTPHRPSTADDDDGAERAEAEEREGGAGSRSVVEPLPGLFQVGSAAVGHLARVLLEEREGAAADQEQENHQESVTETLLNAAKTLWRCPLTSRHYNSRAACERSIQRSLQQASPAARRAAMAARAGVSASSSVCPVRVRACDAWLPVVGTSLGVVAHLRLVLFCEDFGPASPSHAVGNGGLGDGSAGGGAAVVKAPRVSPSSIREALNAQAAREAAALVRAVTSSSSASGGSRLGGRAGDVDGAISGQASVDLGGLGTSPAAASEEFATDGSNGIGPVPGVTFSPSPSAGAAFGDEEGGHQPAAAAAAAATTATGVPSRALLDPLLLSIAAREEAAWAAWRAEAEREWTAAKAAAEAEWRTACENSYATRLTALETAWAEREGERQTAVALAQENIARIEAKLRRLLAAAEAKERDAERLKDAARASAEIRMLDINSLAKRLREDAEHASSLAKQREAAAAARVNEMSAELESLRAQCGRLKADNDALTTALARGPEAALRDTLATVQAEAAALQRTIAEHKANAESERRAKEEARVQVLRLAREVARLREEARAREQAEQQRLKVAYLAAEERYVLEGDRALLRGIRREVDSIANQPLEANAQATLTPQVAAAAAAAAPAPLAAAPPAAANSAASGDAFTQEVERLKRERRNLMAATGSGGGGYTASHPLVLAIDRQIMALREQQAQAAAANAKAAAAAAAAQNAAAQRAAEEEEEENQA